jgi:hypothetical protein
MNGWAIFVVFPSAIGAAYLSNPNRNEFQPRRGGIKIQRQDAKTQSLI